MFALTPESVPIEFCIESETRGKCMLEIWSEPEGFILDQLRPWSVSQCLGCKYCSVAQLVERKTVNFDVACSSHAGAANKQKGKK